jgi:hypothetical protein
LRKTPIFFAENWQKSQKIVIIIPQIPETLPDLGVGADPAAHAGTTRMPRDRPPFYADGSGLKNSLSFVHTNIQKTDPFFASI